MAMVKTFPLGTSFIPITAIIQKTAITSTRIRRKFIIIGSYTATSPKKFKVIVNRKMQKIMNISLSIILNIKLCLLSIPIE